MKNRARFVGLRSQDAKVYPRSEALMASGAGQMAISRKEAPKKSLALPFELSQTQYDKAQRCGYSRLHVRAYSGVRVHQKPFRPQ